MKKFVAMFCAVALSVAMFGCEKKSDTDKAIENLKDAGKAAAEAVEKGAKEADKAAQKVADEANKAAQNLAK